MRRTIGITALLALLYGTALSGKQNVPSPQPGEFCIGRHTFFDFGPPFDFYELFVVRPARGGTSIERITVTPGGMGCTPEKVERQVATVPDSVSSLLAAGNPCAIPEKALRREMKRCKKCVTFSGANVVMQVQCSDRTRLIRSDILDRDMFDPRVRTPEHTAWTMQLLDRLDQAVGPSVMDKPIFAMPDTNSVRLSGNESPTLSELASGKYDALFAGAPHNPSQLYVAAQRPFAGMPDVRLLRSFPAIPDLITLPEYPPLARMTHIEGVVAFTIDLDRDGHSSNLLVASGNPLLRLAVTDAVRHWTFSPQPVPIQVQAAIEFKLHCGKEAESKRAPGE